MSLQCRHSGMDVRECKRVDLCDCFDYPDFDEVPLVMVECAVCKAVLVIPEPDDEEFPSWVEIEADERDGSVVYLCWRHADD